MADGMKNICHMIIEAGNMIMKTLTHTDKLHINVMLRELMVK